MSVSLSITRRAAHITAVLFGLLFTTFVTAFANGAPAQLSWQELKADTSLGKQVTLEAKRLPISDFLAQVGTQSSITLALATDSALSEKLVTARISQMKLYDFMGAIARTYNAVWSKASPQKFVLSEKPADAIGRGIAQLGMPLFYRYRDRLLTSDVLKMPGDNIMKQRADLYERVLLAAGELALQTEKGVSLQSLPPELVTSLEDQYMQANAVELLLKYTEFKSLSDRNIVRITIKQDPHLAPDPLRRVYEGDPDPLEDKVITIEVLTPEKQALPRNNPLSWLVYGRDIKQKLQSRQPGAH